MTNLPSCLSRLSLLALLLLLVPRVGLAAGEDPAPARDEATHEAPSPESSAPPGTEGPSRPRLEPDGSSQAWATQPQPQPQRPGRGVRILAETGASLLTGAGGALAGSLTGTLLCGGGFLSRGSGFIPCLDALTGGFLLGTGLGFSMGTFWGGQAAGGNGSVLGALAGTASGALVGTLVALTMDNKNMGLLLFSFPLALIGSMVGYELTDRGPLGVDRRTPAVALARPHVQPVLAVSSRGALLGLGGAF